MKIIDSGMELTTIIIDKFEKELGVVLPEDYRQFMLKNNGGTPVGNWGFDFVENGTSESTGSIISYFEIIYEENTMEVDDLKAGYRALLESEQISSDYVPIADDPFGNIIFFVWVKQIH